MCMWSGGKNYNITSSEACQDGTGTYSFKDFSFKQCTMLSPSNEKKDEEEEKASAFYMHRKGQGEEKVQKSDCTVVVLVS